jgi:hypothetical protein
MCLPDACCVGRVVACVVKWCLFVCNTTTQNTHTHTHTHTLTQMVDGNRKIVAHRINGYIPGRIMLLLANIHTKPRPIWFSRHGESQFNAQGRIGGDSPLSPRGLLYASKLNEFISGIYPPRSVMVIHEKKNVGGVASVCLYVWVGGGGGGWNGGVITIMYHGHSLNS